MCLPCCADERAECNNKRVCCVQDTTGESKVHRRPSWRSLTELRPDPCRISASSHAAPRHASGTDRHSARGMHLTGTTGSAAMPSERPASKRLALVNQQAGAIVIQMPSGTTCWWCQSDVIHGSIWYGQSLKIRPM